GTACVTVVSSTLIEPYGIALDLQRGNMWLTDIGQTQPTVFRVEMDATTYTFTAVATSFDDPSTNFQLPKSIQISPLSDFSTSDTLGPLVLFADE
ncbi:unnamed protein product, partial [Chrysoparadoxa australica]